jgi:hypothetical protein
VGKLKLNCLYSDNSQVPDQRWGTWRLRKAYGAVSDKYGAVVEWWSAGEKHRTQRNLLQHHHVHTSVK